MRKLILCLAFVCVAFGQTSTFPAVLDDPSTFFKITRNGIVTSLRFKVEVGDSVISVRDCSDIVPRVLLTLGRREIVEVTAVGTNCDLTVNRAFDGTTAVTHANNAEVAGYPTAWERNALKSAIVAMQNALGANLANVGSGSGGSGAPSSSTYNFTPQSPGGSLIAGVTNVVTMTPCPAGLNSTDTSHWLYLSGGTGTAEAVLIVGGGTSPCTSGAATGTITFVPTFAHSGAWTIRSATAGISEFNQTLCTAGGGTLSVPSGTHTLYAHVETCSQVSMRGAGRGLTILQVAAGSWTPLAAPWVNSGNPGINVVVSSRFAQENVDFSGFTIDGNRSNQSGTRPYGFPMTVMGSRHGTIADVEVRNFHTFGAGIGLIGPQTADILVDRNYVLGEQDLAVGECVGGIFSQGPDNIITNNYLTALCDDGIVPSLYRAKRNKVSHNTVIAHAGNVGLHAEGTYDTVFSSNTVAGNWASCFGATDLFGGGMGDVIFDGNTCKKHVVDPAQSGTSQGIPDNGFVGASSPNDLTISGSTITFSNNIVEGCEGRGFSSGGAVKRLIVTGNTIKGCVYGIAFESAAITPSPDTVVITGNIVDHNAPYGILLAANAANKPIENFILANNIVTDTTAPKVQTHGLVFSYSGTTFDKGIIANNLLTGNSVGSILNFNLSDFKGTFTGNRLDGSWANLDGFMQTGSNYLQIGKNGTSGDTEIDGYSSGNANVVDGRIVWTGGSGTAYTGEMKLHAARITLDGIGYFKPKVYAWPLPDPVAAGSGVTIVCSTCDAGAAGATAASGAVIRWVFSDGANWLYL